MRQIKFRAWNGKKMIEPQTASNNAEFFMGQNSGGLEYSEYLGKGNYKKHPLMQFTGLHDKNGKEIFEGDVYKREGRKTYDVVTDIRNFACKYEKYEGRLLIEIIGNIYEHPNLLN